MNFGETLKNVGIALGGLFDRRLRRVELMPGP